ncbi:hypothetical protein C1H70_15645 [Halomonas urumqiensis]|uniref:Uncharacterized protein n=2 Tax=Halomonas urumqiensis TaxID=1684789 RepID=A0A2N7UCM2_9GAMM|nr:hypothetical protein [Halomonas urumqiensis]PMR78204.1 hypothetical protein C1H70_15645 [Halomonas urumqiensis]PTB03352.1 hypothetical protein C6V82_02280 [Halomonas urumqiensis]GHE20482.1 hypothetical protein GCM10017767_10030 [Halomonas urumqiensis]
MIRRQLMTCALGMALSMAPLGTLLAWESDVEALEQRWEEVTTQLPQDQRGDALGELAERAEWLVSAHPGEAVPLIWHGIIEASHARERGGFGALGSARSARDSLEAAIEIDPQGGNGSAYVTLGALYDRVPGRPLGFGNSETAERMFERALAIRPEGIDVNFYYAAFLEEEGRLDEALAHAKRAVDGQARASREVSDEALRRDARVLLARLSR